MPPPLDLLPPEVLSHLGFVAWGFLFLGLMLWLFGVALARLSIAGLLGAVGAAVGTLVVPRMGLDISVLTGGILGFIVGALVGVLAFRFIQAFTLALCLGLAVAGTYYRWHVAPLPLTPPVATQPASNPTTQNARPHLRALAEQLLEQVRAIPRPHLKRMSIAAMGSAVIALLLALGFPRGTTTGLTSLLGSLLIMASTYTLAERQTPRIFAWWPRHLLGGYLVLAALVGVGILIQYRFFISTSDNPSKTKKSKSADPPAN